jgi:hypothetical protein
MKKYISKLYFTLLLNDLQAKKQHFTKKKSKQKKK